MIRQSRRDQALAVCLSALAGFVDSIGFLYLGGFFVSFMSGNSTRLAVGLATDPVRAALPLELIGAFVLGVILGSLGARLAGGRRRCLVLSIVSTLLCMAGGVALSGTQIVPALLASASMGAVNTLFEAEGDVSFGLTYMTGTLVKFGLRLSAALTGGAIGSAGSRTSCFGWACWRGRSRAPRPTAHWARRASGSRAPAQACWPPPASARAGTGRQPFDADSDALGSGFRDSNGATFS